MLFIKVRYDIAFVAFEAHLDFFYVPLFSTFKRYDDYGVSTSTVVEKPGEIGIMLFFIYSFLKQLFFSILVLTNRFHLVDNVYCFSSFLFFFSIVHARRIKCGIFGV
jgi:hypothetical protein